MSNITRLFDAQTDRAWDMFFRQRKFDEGAALCQRLLLESRLSDANQACLHLILAHTNDHAVEHAQRSLELYRGLYDGKNPTEEADEALKTAIEVAKEVLDNAEKREEEDAQILEEDDDLEVADELEEEAATGGDKIEKAGDVPREEEDPHAQYKFGGKYGKKSSGEASVSAGAAYHEVEAKKEALPKTSEPSNRYDSFNPDKL